MIPNHHNRQVTAGGVTASGTFGISRKDEAHLMGILRDTLYSDKVLAVLREYSANAWDANRATGEKDLPIKVTLPTEMAPTLSIQDFGPGLSIDDVFTVYTQYGASTKRDSDDAVGMLGIGSKSGFSYSDSFTIISCHGGMRRTFVAILDATNVGVINLLYEEPCASETGVTIQIPVKQGDIPEFERKAEELFQHFVPRPIINLELPAPHSVAATLENGDIYDTDRGWIAVMGCVPYRVNLDQLEEMPEFPQGGHLQKLSGVLNFRIGEVQVNASREELKYGDTTKQALVKKLNDLVDEYVTKTLDDIERSGLTKWEQRNRAQILNSLGIPVPKDRRELTARWVSIQLFDSVDVVGADGKPILDLDGKPTKKDTPRPSKFKLFHQHSQEDEVKGLTVRDHTKVWLMDDQRQLGGFHNLGGYDVILKPTTGFTLEEAVEYFKEVLVQVGADGVPMANLSTATWSEPRKKAKAARIPNKKHSVRSFQLLEGRRYSHPWSNNWAIVDRVPTPEDVFVILESFQPTCDFYDAFRNDRDLADVLGFKMPSIYGYKSTEKKPLTSADIVGVPWLKWRQTFVPKLLEIPAVAKQFNDWQWVRYFQESGYSYGYNREERWAGNVAAMTELIGKLGKDHPISSLLRRRLIAVARTKKLLPARRATLERLSNHAWFEDKKDTVEPAIAMAELATKYPLLQLPGFGLPALWKGDHTEVWLDYVKTMDRVP